MIIYLHFILQGDTTYLIYSYHSQDPVDNEHFSRHEFQGSFTINLFGQPETLPSLPDDVQYLDIINNNVSDKSCSYPTGVYMPITSMLY